MPDIELVCVCLTLQGEQAEAEFWDRVDAEWRKNMRDVLDACGAPKPVVRALHQGRDKQEVESVKEKS